MKKLEKLVLSQLAKRELSWRQQAMIKGGKYNCTCGCCYAGGGGGSSSLDNGIANCDSHLKTQCSDTTMNWIGC